MPIIKPKAMKTLFFKTLFPAAFLLIVFLNTAHADTLSIVISKNKHAAIYYESYGEGLPIVILHRTSAGYLEPIFSERDNYKRIYIDPPGIGNSSSDDWIKTADDCFEILNAAVNALVPSGDFAIGGFSYFGYMSMAIADRNATRIGGLLLMCPVTTPERSERTLPETRESFTDSSFYKTLDETQQKMLDGLVIKNEASYHAITHYHPLNITLDTAVWNRIKRKNYAITYTGTGKKINAPVLLLLGLQDDVVGYKDALSLVDKYPSISVVVADYASHNLPFEQYDILKQNVNIWLDRIEIYNKH